MSRAKINWSFSDLNFSNSLAASGPEIELIIVAGAIVDLCPLYCCNAPEAVLYTIIPFAGLDIAVFLAASLAKVGTL